MLQLKKIFLVQFMALTIGSGAFASPPTQVGGNSGIGGLVPGQGGQTHCITSDDTNCFGEQILPYFEPTDRPEINGLATVQYVHNVHNTLAEPVYNALAATARNIMAEHYADMETLQPLLESNEDSENRNVLVNDDNDEGESNVVTDFYASSGTVVVTKGRVQPVLDSDSGGNITETGTGNVVTSVTASNGTVTVTKGRVQIPSGGENATTYASIWVE